MSDGKLTDVLIEDHYITDQATGVREWYELTVWADEGMLDIIQSVPGVYRASCYHWPTKYSVGVDPRYDREWVKAEIEARIKIGGAQ